MRCLLSMGLVLIAASLSYAANSELLNEVTRLAGSIKYFPAGTSIDSVPNYVREKAGLEFAALAKKHREAEWWELTNHASPKVRSLAILAISWKDNPKSLERLLPLLQDKQNSFLSQDAAQSALIPPWDVKQTVSEFAEAHIDEYLKAAGFRYGIDPRSPQTPGFKVYWDERKDRGECYSWLIVSLQRASRAYYQPGKNEKLKHQPFIAIQKRIDALPFPDRAWTRLGLSTPKSDGRFDQNGNLLATHAERIAAAKELGIERLLNVLRNQIDSDDPDIRSPDPIGNRSHFSNGKIYYWLLKHADAIFQPEDAEKILQATSSFDAHITAAKLSPPDASRFLSSALDRAKKKHRSNPEFARLYVAVWRHFGPQSQNEVLDWVFFANAEKFGNIRPMRELLSEPEGRALLKMIWQDERCETMTWRRMAALVFISHAPGHNRLVSEEEYRKARPAFGGQDHVFKGGKQKEYVRDPVAAKRYFADWRARALKSLSEELD